MTTTKMNDQQGMKEGSRNGGNAIISHLAQVATACAGEDLSSPRVQLAATKLRAALADFVRTLAEELEHAPSGAASAGGT